MKGGGFYSSCTSRKKVDVLRGKKSKYDVENKVGEMHFVSGKGNELPKMFSHG